MCGRFAVDDTVWSEVERLVGWLDHSMLGSGDIFPSTQILLLRRKAGMGDNAEEAAGMRAGETESPLQGASDDIALSGSMARWGYPGYGKGRSLINARAETVQEKPSFRMDFAKRRCVIPAKGFYEWNSQKEKFYFSGSVPVLYLAGIYSNNPGEECVTILTTQANESVQPVHGRMLLIVPKGKIGRWIGETDWAIKFLRVKPPVLKREKARGGYEQLSLPL